MLSNTLVCNLQEFGRTPRDQSGRRTRSLAAMLDQSLCRWRRARGACRRPQRCDRRRPCRAPVDPPEIVGTIYRSLGLDLETKLPGPQGRPFPLVDFGKHEIKELF